jgi:hypothetical protein
MGTKNNPKNRGKTIKKKTHNNKDVEPILYVGNHAGHGRYITGKYAGTAQIISDDNGKPLPWESI